MVVVHSFFFNSTSKPKLVEFFFFALFFAVHLNNSVILAKYCSSIVCIRRKNPERTHAGTGGTCKRIKAPGGLKVASLLCRSH